jgi:uncharacterized protein YdhG (YjbR/CyaY superfamily)
MVSKASDVQAYIAEAPEERQPALKKLRSLCRKHLKGYEECIEYGMPVYKRDGAMEISFASQKQYIALYVLRKDVLAEFRDALGATSIGKGCVRFTKPSQIDFTVIEKLLVRNAESKSPICE